MCTVSETRFTIRQFRGSRLHCKEDPIYEFPEIKLRGLVPNFNIPVSVSDLNLALALYIYIRILAHRVYIKQETLEVNVQDSTSVKNLFSLLLWLT
jgi:hypothetical protein